MRNLADFRYIGHRGLEKSIIRAIGILYYENIVFGFHQ